MKRQKSVVLKVILDSVDRLSMVPGSFTLFFFLMFHNFFMAGYPMFDSAVKGVVDTKLGPCSVKFVMDLWYMIMVAHLLCRLLQGVRRLCYKKICKEAFFSSARSVALFVAVYSAIHFIVRNICSEMRDYVLFLFSTVVMVSIVVPILDSIVLLLEERMCVRNKFQPQMKDETNKRESINCKCISFKKIDTYFFSATTVFGMLPLFVLLGFFLMSGHPLSDASVLAADGLDVTPYRLKFISDLISVGVFAVLMYRSTQVVDDWACSKVEEKASDPLLYQAGMALALAYMFGYIFILRPMNTVISFVMLIIFSIGSAFTVDCVTSDMLRGMPDIGCDPFS